MTERIAELTAHMKKNKHDFAARRALLQLVGKRKRHLKYIAAGSGEEYLALSKNSASAAKVPRLYSPAKLRQTSLCTLTKKLFVDRATDI
jgi:hypothetical protein